MLLNGTASTNDKGEYRIASLVPGKYFVMARCQLTVPLPHSFIRRGSDVEIPSQGYAPLFYPGAPDLSGGARVVAAAGAEVTGIDSRMSPAVGVTVRGHVTAAGPQALPGNLQFVLEPRDPVRLELLRIGARFDKQSGDFRFQQVLPGSYEITASTSSDSAFYCARVPINIGSTAPEPLELKLVPAVTLSGMISFDGEGKAPFENMRVMLNRLEHQLPCPPPQAQVQKDGSFGLPGVVPGRWRLDASPCSNQKSKIKNQNSSHQITNRFLRTYHRSGGERLFGGAGVDFVGDQAVLVLVDFAKELQPKIGELGFLKAAFKDAVLYPRAEAG